MSDEFFNGLKSKLKHVPSKDFDKDFWENFNEEFSEKKAPSKFWTFWMVPASVAAMLVMGVVFYNSSSIPTERLTIGATNSIEEDEDILQNMELLMHIDDEVLDVAHEEWDELLEEGQS